jgi:uncharacterized protein
MENFTQNALYDIDIKKTVDTRIITEFYNSNKDGDLFKPESSLENILDNSPELPVGDLENLDQNLDEDFEMIDYEAEFQKARPYDACSVNVSKYDDNWYHYLVYGIIGILFGILFIKAEIISWYRIQEMFRLESFHMYGVIGSAVMVGIVSIFLIKKFHIKTIRKEDVIFQEKRFNKGQIIGGLIFGLGWGITGACPGPLFAQIGTGSTVIVITLLAAVLGTWIYGNVIDKLPR